MFFPVRLDDPGKVKLIGVEPGIPKGLDDIWLKKKISECMTKNILALPRLSRLSFWDNKKAEFSLTHLIWLDCLYK